MVHWVTQSATSPIQSAPPDLRLVHELRLGPHEWRGNGNYTEQSREQRCAARQSPATPPTGGSSKLDLLTEYIQYTEYRAEQSRAH